MKTIAKCAAVASVVMLTAGSAAWAQNYGSNPNFGPGPNNVQQSFGAGPGNVQNELSRFGYTDVQNVRPMRGWSADAMQNGQMVHVIIGDNGRIATFRGVNQGNINVNSNSAQNELSKYGFDNIRNLTPQRGWSADAMKNGQMVHVILNDNGMIATFRGVNGNQGSSGSSGPYAENTEAGYGGNQFLMNQIGSKKAELSQYGYSDIHNIRPTQGWSADATRNGENIHVLLGDNGLVATFRGQ